MKAGKTLAQLAQELERINATKRDFVVPTEMLKAEALPNPETGKEALNLSIEGQSAYGVNSWTMGQLAQYADVPKQYLDRIAIENPKLAARNINHGFESAVLDSKKDGRNESRLVRTLDGNVRGLLSSRYRILDAHDMLEATLPTILENQMKVVSSEITDTRLYLKCLSPKLEAEVKKGDVVQMGLVVSTSDVGAGSVRVEPMIWRLVCQNGLIMPSSMRKYHVGKNQAEDAIRELLTDRTRELTDAAFWAQVRDVVIASMRPEMFQKEVDRLRVAANEEIKNFDLPRVVELTMKATGITGEGKKNSIVAALANGNEGAGLTRWGLINAMTRAAHDEDISYDQSVELERAAGLVLELPRKDWEHISAKSA